MTHSDPGSSDTPKKDAAAVRVFPPAVPLATVAIGVLLQRFWPLGPDVMLDARARYAVGGAIILAAIALLGFRAIRVMRRSGQSENPFKTTTEIVQTGPYRVTRNPMYLMMVLVCIGFAIALANLWILILTPVCALALQILVILPEERYLESKFGDIYVSYKSRVRRWI